MSLNSHERAIKKEGQTDTQMSKVDKMEGCSQNLPGKLGQQSAIYWPKLYFLLGIKRFCFSR